ncbi:MAG: cytochrome c family protein [Rhizobiaceae bacterium]|nr:cytochrome c family protein [Rhizobiaceae bacterium]
MDSFQLNKIIGALLGTVFVVFSITLLADALFAAHPPETPGYAIEAAEEGGHGGPAEEKETVSIAALLQDADPAKGEGVFRKCQACHTPEQGGANKVGPNLWGLVNRPVASHEGFSYSAGMRDFAAGGAQVWDYEHLNEFLINPKGYVKGTAMAFAGLKKDPERADLIAYLRTLSDNPAPLPEAPMEEAESAAAPEGDAATTEESSN